MYRKFTRRDEEPQPVERTYSIAEAAAIIGVNPTTIRRAIKRGELAAFLIGGRDPLRSGAGLGYRINRKALEDWYYGRSSEGGEAKA